ncbi:MAG: PQQ-binding-like beta-propeller repeat protein [Acidobacteriaceae bacterium]|nr:PQQ-binding-like beta-propeller repeat protein [Acidobacteriaceae bacterium]
MRTQMNTCARVTLTVLLLCAGARADWPTYGHDAQRSGWAPEETKISVANAPNMRLLWKAKLENEFYRLSALTAPVVATKVPTLGGSRTVVYVGGIKGIVFALEAETGKVLWTHTFRSSILPGKGRYQGTFLCPNGITATPVIDRKTNVLYVIAPNGALYGLDLATGSVRYGPVHFVAAYSKNWSLSLVDGVVYTTLAQGCGDGISGFYSIDVNDPQRPVIRELLLSRTDTAGLWGRGGPIIGNNGHIYGAAADGVFNPSIGDYSLTVLSATLPDLRMDGYFLPHNWNYLNKLDLDLGSASPAFFGWNNHNYVIHGAKEGFLYIFDAEHLGGADHQTALYKSPRLGNDDQKCCVGNGVYGGMATWRDEDGQTWLYVPVGGPPSKDAPTFSSTNGDNKRGNIMAFKVVANEKTQNPKLEPGWMTGGFDLPDPPVVANGVVFALSTGENPSGPEDKRLLNTRPAVLRAMDAKTGKELFNSGDAIKSWVHFSGLAVTDGMVFAVDHDSNVYCFGSGSEKTQTAP